MPSLARPLLALLLAFPAAAGAQSWTTGDLSESFASPTSCAFGPDGRLYVAQQDGLVEALTLNASHQVTAVQQIPAIRDLGGRTCLGIAFDPLDPPDPVRLYVSHTDYEGDSLYPGTIARLTGPAFGTVETIITGLPVGRIGHATSGMAFGYDGNLYIGNGSNTHAGVPDGVINIPDAPLSSAILAARVHRIGFDGVVRYDQYADPGSAVQTGGFDVGVFAPGLRNPYDVCQHSNGYLYATDNGPSGEAPSSLDCVTAGSSPVAPDELNLIEAGNYYGQPHRGRGQGDPRQCVYRHPSDPLVAGYTPPLATFPSSTDGIVEYYVDAFGGAMRGDLLCAQLGWLIHRAKLAADGRSVTLTDNPIPLQGGLDIEVGPDGTVYLPRYGAGTVGWAAPNEIAPTGPHVLSVFPRAGPLAGGRPVRIYGTGFGSVANTTVTLGGLPCVVTAATATAVDITVAPGIAAGAVDVAVTVAAQGDGLTRAYTYIEPATVAVGPRGGADAAGLRFSAAPSPARLGGAVEFRFTLPAAAAVSLRIYDLAGRERARIEPGVMGAGERAVEWRPPADLGAGIYFARLAASGRMARVTLALLASAR